MQSFFQFLMGVFNISKDDDGSGKVLFRKIIQPRLTANKRLELNYGFTGVTWRDYHNGIHYDEAMVEVC